jgi:hypothetical protein
MNGCGRLLLWVLTGALACAAEPARRVLFIAGPKSHDRDMHEFPRGAELLAEAINRAGLPLTADVSPGWPASDATVAQAGLVVLYSDGDGAHVAHGHVAALRARLEAGRALAVLHFALEPAATDPGLKQLLLDAIGGCFEVNWSVNPVWRLQASPVATHPAARGVGELNLTDEIYFHLRFRDGGRGIFPLLTARPAPALVADDGPRSGNAAVRAALARGEAQTIAWTSTSEQGARGFGYTGGHAHRFWYDDHVRRLVLNGLVWAAGLDVPAGGVALASPSAPFFNTIDEAIARGDLADVQRHLARSPGLVRGIGAKLAPLHQAILRKKPDVAVLLLQAGADVNAPDSAQRTPLHMAVERADAALVKILLDHHARLTSRDRTGWTPLHHAAAKNLVAIARLLLDAGADPNYPSELGGTPLHEAAAGAGAEMIQLLLDRGTDPSIRSKPGVTALDLAREYQNTPAIEMLEKAQR